jgi:hypothetical protein
VLFRGCFGGYMKAAPAILCLLLGIGQLGISQNWRTGEPVLGWMPVKKVCGRLRSTGKGSLTPLPKTRITLYEAKWRTSCCETLKSVASRLTSEYGDFDFGTVGDGRYWLAIELRGKNFKLPIDVNSKHDWEGVCEYQGPIIEKDYIAWAAGRAME